jgi:hypothetical protein
MQAVVVVGLIQRHIQVVRAALVVVVMVEVTTVHQVLREHQILAEVEVHILLIMMILENPAVQAL